MELQKKPPKLTLQKPNIFILYSCLILFWLSCQVYEINIDNPVDAIANAEMEVYPPALTMHPLTQTVSIGDSVTIGAYIVDHDTTLAGVHTHVTFNAEFLQLDTILPGVLFTNDGVSAPLFTYTTDFGQIDIFVWYLGAEGGLAYVTETGHIAECTLQHVPLLRTLHGWNTTLLLAYANWLHLWIAWLIFEVLGRHR